MAEFTLWCFAQSGNAYKVALMLNLCDADWAPRFVDYFGGETRTPAYRAINVMGEVPVLEHRDVRLTQSGVILDYLGSALGKYAPQSAIERRETLRWLLFDNHKLTSYTATYRFMRNWLDKPEPAVLAFLEQRVKGAWGVLEAHLATRRFAIGDRPTIADLSMCGYLYWPEEIGIDMGPFPSIRRWLDDIRALRGWVHPYDLMPGHPLPARQG
jgi:glutathione S-transferase